MYKSVFKPFSDIVFAVLALAIISPLFLLIIILLSLVNRGNPFFLQVRPGKNEKIFKIVKFKTMTNEKDLFANLLPDDKRTTKVGKIIRQSSLDEIPQLLNVIKGDMSIVGPRPLLPEYLPLYNEEQSKRHLVKPGMTGWAQINGRNAISWEEKFKFDVRYVEHLSFFTDLKILIITLKKVVLTHGIYQFGEAKVEVFKGKKI